jgi:hypothetical protein
MGVEWRDETIVIWPYRATRTLRNLRARPEAVVNLVDDILLFVRAALGDPRPPTRPAAVVDGAILDAACSCREVRVDAIDEAQARARVDATVVARGIGREFLGLNRARNAVLEASILATRTRWLPPQEILADLRRLQVIVDKTGGESEHAAMRLVVAHCDARLGTR